MDSPSLPNKNFVGLLQEKCGKNKVNLPEYFKDTTEDKHFKYTCKLGEWTTEGTGFSKKVAKQSAAQAMIMKIDNENLFNECTKNMTKECAISKIYEYCKKEKKEIPLFSEMPEEDDLFVFSCTCEDFTGIGKGATKKIAKENAADSVAKNFNIYNYFENLKKSEKRKSELKNPAQQLHELCQSKKQQVFYKEEKISLPKKIEVYVVTSTVGEFEVKSAQNSSKKLAKMDAARLMLNLLNSTTPDASPKVIETDTYLSVTETKRTLSEYSGGESSDGEPSEKRSKTLI